MPSDSLKARPIPYWPTNLPRRSKDFCQKVKRGKGRRRKGKREGKAEGRRLEGWEMEKDG
jgi:hypothetical protein